MSGISTNIGWIALGVQSVKGTPAAAPTAKLRLTARPSVRPVKNRGRYNMTDSGRDQGPGFTSGMQIAGDFQCYAHPDGIHTPIAAVLGTNVTSAGPPNYVHTATPADDVSWWTVWRMVGNQIREQFVDCKFNTLALEGTAGQPLTLSFGLFGIRSNFIVSDPVLATASIPGLLYPEGSGKLKLDTVARPMFRVSFGVNNNLSPFQADGYFLEDIDPGKREVTASISMRFTGATAEPDYRAFFYGSDGGTTLSELVGTHAFDFQWYRDTNTNLTILLPQVTYAGGPDPQPDPAGDPISLDLACEVEKPSGSAICTVITKNQTATI